MRKYFLITICAFLSLGLLAQEQEAYTLDEEPAQEQSMSGKKAKQGKEKEEKSGVFTGFSGGMLLHGGYLFSDDPRKVFSNSGLGSSDYTNTLPKDGFTFGLGGMLRLHFINHIHLGAEGYVSTMPLMGTGSNIRTGWGGAFCDVFTTWGKVSPLVGVSLGGGSMRRLFVPNNAETVSSSDSTFYNASYTTTPFFYIDPYIGLEVALKSHIALLIRIDYLLPFGKANSKLTENVKWSNFISPTGPRLYIGVMFGKFNKK